MPLFGYEVEELIDEKEAEEAPQEAIRHSTRNLAKRASMMRMAENMRKHGVTTRVSMDMRAAMEADAAKPAAAAGQPDAYQMTAAANAYSPLPIRYVGGTPGPLEGTHINGRRRRRCC